MITKIIFIIVVKIISFLSYLYFLLNINFATVIVENKVINDDINIISYHFHNCVKVGDDFISIRKDRIKYCSEIL